MVKLNASLIEAILVSLPTLLDAGKRLLSHLLADNSLPVSQEIRDAAKKRYAITFGERDSIVEECKAKGITK